MDWTRWWWRRAMAQIFIWVVTDVVMPNMSGGQMAMELTHLRPGVKLLFVSGYAGKTVTGPQSIDLETNFLQKPYTLKQLSGKIRGALKHDCGHGSKRRRALSIGRSQCVNTGWFRPTPTSSCIDDDSSYTL